MNFPQIISFDINCPLCNSNGILSKGELNYSVQLECMANKKVCGVIFQLGDFPSKMLDPEIISIAKNTLVIDPSP